jgi:hypothetical protein
MIVFGGKSTEEEPLNELVILGAEKLAWTRPRTVGDPPSPRQAHSATLVRDSIFYHGMCFIYRKKKKTKKTSTTKGHK